MTVDLKEKPAKALPKFVAVIFANGVDDDIPGFEALFGMEPVLYGERVYQPDEYIDVDGQDLFFSRTLVVDGSPRHARIANCRIHHKGGLDEAPDGSVEDGVSYF